MIISLAASESFITRLMSVLSLLVWKHQEEREPLPFPSLPSLSPWHSKEKILSSDTVNLGVMGEDAYPGAWNMRSRSGYSGRIFSETGNQGL